MRLSIFNLRFQLKKQNKSNVNKYVKNKKPKNVKTKMLKTTTERKKLKTMGHITPLWTTIPGMDRWEILIPCSDM